MKTFLLFFLILTFQISAQNRIQRTVDALVAEEDLKYAAISFCVIDMDSNIILAEHNPDLSLITASTMKAITTGTTLSILGQNFKFETHIEHDGYIKDGVLHGNLYLKGQGDPSMGSSYMDNEQRLTSLAYEFTQSIKKAGIKSIKGNIIGDGSYFEYASTVPSWQWMDTGNHYGAGVLGLNLHDNLYTLNFYQTTIMGGQPKIKSIIPEQHLKIYNEVKSAGKNTGDNAYIFAAPFGNEAWIRGTIPVGSGVFSIKGAVTDPEFFAADWLFHEIKKSGIRVSGNPIAQRNTEFIKDRKKIHTHYSQNLSALIKHTNEDSRNLYCEAYVKMIGKKEKNEGSLEAGIAAIHDFWRKRGINTDGFFMEDGSGLSARNGVNAKNMAQMMRKMFIDKNSFPNYYNLLAVAGKSGTFKYLGKNTALQGNLHGKGGTMNRVRSYTGYITTKSKRRVSFAIIVNNFNFSGYVIRKRLENLMLSIALFED